MNQAVRMVAPSRANSLIDAPIGRSLLFLSLPSVLAMVLQTSVSVAEVFYVGRLGTEALASLALVYPMYMLMMTLSSGALGGMTAGAIARALGTGDGAGADRIAWNALLLASIVGVVVSLLFLANTERLFTWLGGGNGVLDQAMHYASVLFSGAVAIWVFNILMAMLRGSGQMKLSAAITAGVVCVQIPLMGVLILGWGGFDPMGISGAPMAILVAFGLGVVAAAVSLLRSTSSVRLSRRGFALDLPFLVGMVRTTSIAALSPVLTVFSVVLLTRFVGQFGQAALAGYGIGSRLEFLLIPLVFGIGTALTTLVGHNVGAGRLSRALRIAWTGAGAAALIAGTIGGFFALFPGAWANHFSDDPDVLASAYAYLRIAGLGFPFVAIGLALYFASQGANRVGWPLVASSVRILIVVLGAQFVLSGAHVELTDLYTVILLAMFAFGGANVLAIRLGAWRR
ncbi:MAG: MATE family efflux transporter [Gammaproteobacteria bacterium]|nr:MATE family efflux transporter [Gammaproteobacteria bacterium]